MKTGPEPYAVDEVVVEGYPAPVYVAHEIDDDGLTLASSMRHPRGGVITTRVSWSTVDEARANYAKARATQVGRVPTLLAHYEGRNGLPSRSWLWSVARTRRGRWQVYLNVAPPVWWLPRAALIRKPHSVGVQGGWLLVAAAVTWDADTASQETRVAPAAPVSPAAP